MGFVELVTGGQAKKQDRKPVEPRCRGYMPVETISLMEGWRQVEAGTWRGVGLLDVLNGFTHTWGRQIIIAEPGRDRGKLLAQYPKVMIFTPNEFMDAVTGWPENSATILAKRTFAGDIVGSVA